jgi:hypothetical protein
MLPPPPPPQKKLSRFGRFADVKKKFSCPSLERTNRMQLNITKTNIISPICFEFNLVENENDNSLQWLIFKKLKNLLDLKLEQEFFLQDI